MDSTHRVPHNHLTHPAATTKISHHSHGPAPSPAAGNRKCLQATPAGPREALEAPPTAASRLACQPRACRQGLERKRRLEAGGWPRRLRHSGCTGGGVGRGGAEPWRENKGNCSSLPGRSSSLWWGAGSACRENWVERLAPGLRLSPLLCLLSFPRLAPGEGWMGGDSGPVAELLSLQPGCEADGRTRCPGKGRHQGRRRRRGRDTLSAGDLSRLSSQGLGDCQEREAKFLHLGCLKRPRPWRALSSPTSGALAPPRGPKATVLGATVGFPVA